MNLKYIVYKTVNLINNKFYYGVHLTDIDKYDGYIGCGIYRQSNANKHYKFHKAVRKYGYKNFKRYTIAEYSFTDNGKKLAYYLESLIVTKELVNNINCYNTALGGKSSILISSQKIVYKFNLDGELLEVFESLSKAASSIENNNLTSTKRAIMNNCLNKTNSSFGFYWSYTNSFNYNTSNTRKIVQYSINGEFIKIYDSITEAQKELKCNTISQALRKNYCAAGYQWRYYNNNINNIEPIKFIYNKNDLLSINMFDKFGKFIEEFNSINECINKYPNLNSSQINRVLNGKIKSHKGYIFKYS